MADGDDSTDWTEWEDARSPLVCQPVRWVRDLRPRWVALEEVPQVAPLWEQFARTFRRWGYSVWTGDLCAADYGVPQERYRRILMGSLVDIVHPPAPTHAENPQGVDLFGGSVATWVTVHDALEWDEDEVIRPARGAGMIERHGERPDHPATEPAPTVISKARSWTRHKPSPTIVTTRRSAAGMVAGRDLSKGVPVTVEEAGVLQSFPRDYPWQGSRSKKHEQVGNAVPPLLAAHVLAALGAGELPKEMAA
jgi:DNA (cytosine-5)-methyltransferase 1